MDVINKPKKLSGESLSVRLLHAKSPASLYLLLLFSLSAFVFPHWFAARRVSPPPSKEEKPDLSYASPLSLL